MILRGSARSAVLAGAMLLLAQQSTFHDAYGRVIGSERTDQNSITTFHDPAGRVTGKARTDANAVTHFYDAAGRVTGSARQR